MDITQHAKKLIAGAAIVGTLVVGVGGVAYAADSPTSGSPTTTQVRHPRLALHARRAAFKTVLDLTNTTAADLRSALRGGQTVAQYADAHGSSAQAVHDALVSRATSAINQAVANGRISQSRADTLEQNVSGRVDHFLSRTWNAT